MRYYNIEVDYRKNGSPTYSMTCDEDYVVENVSFEEICYHMRSVVNKYVEEGKISISTGYDMIGDIHMFNEFMERYYC